MKEERSLTHTVTVFAYVLILLLAIASHAQVKIRDMPNDPDPADSDIIPMVKADSLGSWSTTRGTLRSGLVPTSRIMSCSTPLLCNDVSSINMASDITLSISDGYPFYDLRTYGGAGDGITDNSPPLMSALVAMPSSGGTIYISEGDWRFNSTVTIDKPVTILGAGPNSSVLKATFVSGNLFNVTSQWTGFHGLGFDSTVTKTSGAFINYPSGGSASGSTIDDFRMIHWYIGIDIATAAGVRISRGTISFPFTGALAGIRITDGNDHYIWNVTMNTGVIKPTAGILVTNTGSLNMTDLDIIGMNYDLLIQGGYSIWAENCFFDSAVKGIWIDPINPVMRLRFANSWTSSHSSHGFQIGGGSGTNVATNIEIVNHHSFFNAGNGLILSDHATDVQVGNGFYSGNSGNGITVGTNLTKIGIVGSTIGDNIGTGISIASGTGDYIRILDNLITSNGTNLTNSASGSNVVIYNNLPSSVNSVYTLTSSQFANQGTTTTLLHGNASGNPSWSSVSLSDMSTMATSSFLGRNTAGTGIPEVLSVSTAKTMLNLTGTNSGDQVVPINESGTSSQWLRAYNSSTGAWTKSQPAFSDISGSLAHSSLSNLTSSDDHTQYVYLSGRSGGQSLTCGTAASNACTFSSTSNGTKGISSFDSFFYIDGVNSRIGIGPSAPTRSLDVDQTSTGAVAIRIQNDSSGTGADARVEIFNDSGNSFTVLNRSSGNTGTFLGVTTANYGQISGSSSLAGVLIGTVGTGTLRLGTNNIEHLQMDANGHLIHKQSSVPTVSCTGTGISAPSPTLVGTDHAFTVTINTGTSPSATGTCTVTFSSAYVTTKPPMSCMLVSGASNWGGNSTIIQTTESLTAPVFTWTDVAALVSTALTGSSSYKFSCVAIGI